MDKFDGGATPAKGCFAKLEAKDVPGASADKVCTTTGDTATVETQVDGVVADLLATLEGTPPVPSQTFPATGQTACWDGDGNVVACAGTGQDGDVQAGGALAYQGHGDRTITDLNTALMWTKKSDDGTLHDQDNCYPWRGVCAGDGSTKCGRDADCAGVGGTCDTADCQPAPNGLTIFEWVDAINAASFAGYADWRLPNIRELHSLVNFAAFHPAVAPALLTGCTPGCTVTTCSCTAPVGHWSSTTARFAADAWFVFFSSGDAVSFSKSSNESVRAVRGGL